VAFAVQLFRPWYERALAWARHPRAPAILGGLSFVEAFVFPIPPEVMLAPMTLAQPRCGLWFATISLACSLVGCFVGYALGYYALELIEPLIGRIGYGPRFAEVKAVAGEHGFWFLLIGGFAPIPFKLLTIAAGAVQMPLLPFFFGALIGRGKRVYILAGAIMLAGERAERWIHRYIEPIGWVALALLAALLVALWLWH
jgi:membrane protein YqaA with SNARE-associated domain